MQVRKLTIRRLELPLTVPYRLSLGDIRTFETILVEAGDGQGAAGFGEATLLTGYTDETVEESWTRACALAERAAGLAAEDAKARSEEHTSEIQPLMRNSYAVYCLKTKNEGYGTRTRTHINHTPYFA